MPRTLFTNANLLDGENPPRSGVNVVLEGNRITGVSDDAPDAADGDRLIDLAGKTEIADFMVIANGTSKRQVGAMADHLQRKIKASGLKGLATEGLDNCDWVLIDAGDIIVHLFRPEVRSFYNLERMWAFEGSGETGQA
mgnify:CR=1 FL=1